MRRLLALVFFFCTLNLAAQFRDGLYSSLEDSETVRKMKEYTSFLSAAVLEGRAAGSKGEKEAAVYISDKLTFTGLDLLSGKEGEIFGMRQENGDTLTSRNVIAYIPGYDKELRNHYIVIGARLDNLGSMEMTVDGQKREKIFYGANGNASGLALLMNLAETLNTNKVLLKRSIIIAFFGSSLKSGAGSWYFLNRSFKDVPNIDAMINLDMLGTGSRGFYAYTASNVALNQVIASLSATLQPVHPEIVSMEPVNSDHRQFYDKEIPAVLFTTGMYPEYNSDKDTESILEYDEMERESEYIYNFALSLANGEKPAFRKDENVSKNLSSASIVTPYYDCDTKPIFLGSNDPADFLRKWVYVYLKYPQQAVQEGIQGRVLVDFIIDEKGKVTDVKVLKGVDPLLDDEAVRVISASPDWKPAKIKGEKVKCEMSLYVDFKLERKKR